MPPAEWPDWLPGIPRREDADHSAQRKPPEGIVIHSGDRGPDLADAALKMSISYHLAWDVAPRTPGRFVQLVSLQRRAYHAGSEGNDWLGIALSGPWTQDPRSEREREAFEALLGVLCDSFGGSLRWWCRHSDITPGTRDPGPGFSEEWVGGRLTWRRGPRG